MQSILSFAQLLDFYIRKSSPGRFFSIAGLLVGSAIITDLVTPYRFSSSLFYWGSIFAFTWRYGYRIGLYTVLCCCSFWLLFRIDQVPNSHPQIILLWNLLIRSVEFLAFCITSAFAQRLFTSAEEEIETLRGILPICAYCKKIKNDKGSWEQIESYISKVTPAKFSHGMCPECYLKAMKEIENLNPSSQ